MIYNMGIETQPVPTAQYTYFTGSVSYSGSPEYSGVWCPCPGQKPVVIVGYYDNGSSAWVFAQDLVNNPFQQASIAAIDKTSSNTFIDAPVPGTTYNAQGKTTAGVQTGRARGTAGTCYYRVIYLQ